MGQRNGRDADITDQAAIREIHSRAKRIETRLTQMAIALGVRTDAQRPIFHPGSEARPARLTLPSPHCSAKEMVDSVPRNWQGPVGVFVGEELILTISRGTD